MDDTEERTPSDIADALLDWAANETISKARGLSDALYTLSEGHKFEEESISMRSALICHGLIEKLRMTGELPPEYRL